MEHPVETLKHNGHTIRIYRDDDDEGPRQWDNLGTMVCFHRHYELGDKRHGISLSEIEEAPDTLKYLQQEYDAYIVLPLYLFDHSGLSMSTSAEGFRAFDSAGWDWGCVGFIFCTKAQVRESWRHKRISKRIRDLALECLVQEVKIYDQYLTGDVYGYTIDEGCDVDGDSLWGIYGLDYCIAEAKAAVASMAPMYDNDDGEDYASEETAAV